MALVAAQALERRSTEQAEMLRSQAARIEELERVNADVMSRLEALEKALAER